MSKKIVGDATQLKIVTQPRTTFNFYFNSLPAMNIGKPRCGKTRYFGGKTAFFGFGMTAAGTNSLHRRDATALIR